MKGLLGGALALTLAAAGGAQDPKDEVQDVFPPEAQGLAERFEALVKDARWSALIQEYQKAMADPELRRKVVRLKAAGPKAGWTSVVGYLNGVVSKLPPEALEELRVRGDNAARRLYRTAVEQGDTAALEEIVEAHFFSSVADEAALDLATRLTEEGRHDDAAYFLDRLLRYYPDPDRSIPRALVAARLVHALASAGNLGRLQKLAAWLEEQKIEDAVTVGGRLSTPAELARAALAAPRPAAAAADEVGGPVVVDALQAEGRFDGYLRNEIRLRSCLFDEADETLPAAERVPAGAVAGDPAQTAYPYFPAYARYGEREVVVASDGTRVAAIDPRSGRTYWVFDGRGRPGPDPAGQRAAITVRENVPVGNSSPFMGATIDGEYAYVTMVSTAAGAVKRDQDMMRAYGVNFPLAARVVCFRLADPAAGRILTRAEAVVWDTDERYWQEWALRRQPNEDPTNNWSFCSPPLVVGDRLYVGIVVSPGAESESYVACLDRRTGRLRWRTYLCQASGRFGNFQWGQGQFVMPLTLLTQGNGLIYAASNQGAVAALHPVNGSLQWISLYPRQPGAPPPQHPAMGSQGHTRAPSLPVLVRGRLYVLPQDARDLLVFDAADGTAQPAPKLPASATPTAGGGGGAASAGGWENHDRIQGTLGDYVVVLGRGKSVAIDTSGGTSLVLYGTDAAGRGIGTIAGTYIYLPIGDGPSAKLFVYRAGTWRLSHSALWREKEEAGNVLVAGPYVISMGRDRLTIYTDSRVVRGWYAGRMLQDPPDLDALVAYGMILHENEQHQQAAEPLLRYLRASEGIVSEAARRAQIQTNLGKTFMERGHAAFEAKQYARAAEEYERALDYASDHETIGSSALNLAESYAKLGRPADAVRRLHELRRRFPERPWPHPQDVQVRQTLWDVATQRIGEYLKGAGADAEVVLKELELQAGEALQQIGEAADAEKLLELLRRFPESRLVAGRLREAARELLASDRLRDAERILRDLGEIDPKAVGQELRRQLIEAFERGRLYERARQELQRLKELFGAEPMGQEAGGKSVGEWAEAKRAALEGPPAAPPAAAPRTLARLAAIKDPERAALPGKTGLGEAAGPAPLGPAGPVPPAIGLELELLRVGSSVELWNVVKGERIWSAPHPGGWLGLLPEPKPEGLRVQTLVEKGPAQAAGLKTDDLILAIDGRPAASADVLAEALRPRAPGEAVRLRLRRAGEARELEVALGTRPAHAAPAIVAAAFASDGSLVVAWPDRVAALEAAGGKLLWSWPLPALDKQIDALACGSGRVFVLAADRREAPARQTGRMATQAIVQAEHLLYALDDLSGRLRWTRTLDRSASYALYADAAWDAVLLRGNAAGPGGAQAMAQIQEEMFVGGRSYRAQDQRGGPPAGRLELLEAAGGLHREKPIQDVRAQPQGFVLDAAGCRAIWLDPVANALNVRGLKLTPSAPEPRHEKLSLDAKYGAENGALHELVLWGDRVALVARASTPKLWCFRLTEKGIEPVVQLKLPERWDLVRAHAGWATPQVDAAGTLLVYAVERERDPISDENAPGYLFRWALGGDGAEPLGPPSLVPGLAQGAGRIETGLSPLVLFAAPGSRGALGEAQDNRVTLYDPSGRILKPEIGHVEVQNGAIQAWVRRGRLYFRRAGELLVYAPVEQEPAERLDLGSGPPPRQPAAQPDQPEQGGVRVRSVQFLIDEDR